MDTSKQDTTVNAIDVEGLSFSYRGVPVLLDISFSFPMGDYVGVIGPNGGGKTTLLKLLLGLLPIQSGTIRICGKTIAQAKRERGIGYVPQRVTADVVSFPASVAEVVLSGIAARPWLFTISRTHERVTKVMELVGITHLASRRLGELSGGERQRVFIARSLVNEPALLFLDEPTVGVDLKAQEQFMQLLERINRELGTTILLVSHDIDAIGKQVKHVLCLNQSLVCHLCADDFIHGDVLERLYGSKNTVLHHHH